MPNQLSARGSISARGKREKEVLLSIVQPTQLLKSIRGKFVKPGALKRYFRAAALALIVMIRLRPRLSGSEVAAIKAAYDISGGISSISKFLLFAQSLGVQVQEDAVREVLGHHSYEDGHMMNIRTVTHAFERCKRDQLAAQLKGSAALEAFDSLGGDTVTGVVEVSRMMDAIDMFGLNVDIGKVAEQERSKSPAFNGQASMSMTTRGSGGGGGKSVISYQAFTDLVGPRAERSGDENWWTTVEDEHWLDTNSEAWSPQRGEIGFDIQQTPSAAVVAKPAVAASIASAGSESFFSVRIDFDSEQHAGAPDRPFGATNKHGGSFRGLGTTLSMASMMHPSQSEHALLGPSVSRQLLSKTSGCSQGQFDAEVSVQSSTGAEEPSPTNDDTAAATASMANAARCAAHDVKRRQQQAGGRPSTAPTRSAVSTGSKAQRWKDFIDRTEEDGERRSASRVSSAAASRHRQFILSTLTAPCFDPPAAPAPLWRDDIKSAQLLEAKQRPPSTDGKPAFLVRPVYAMLDAAGAGKRKTKKAVTAAVGAIACQPIASTTADGLSCVPCAAELMGRWTLTQCNPRHGLSA